MENSRNKYNKLVKRIKDENISIGLLSIVSGESRSSLRTFLSSATKTVREEKYEALMYAIDKIISEDLRNSDITKEVLPKPSPTKPKKVALRKLLRTNNLSPSKAAQICGITCNRMNGYLSFSGTGDLSDKLNNDITGKLERYIEEKARVQLRKDKKEISKLTEFIPIFEDENFDSIDRSKKNDPFYTSYSEDVDRFIHKVGSDYWLKLDYSIDYAKKFMQDQSLINDATLDDIKQIFTFLQRGERFCSGMFGEAFDNGVLLACLYRLQQILEDQ